MVPVQLDDLPHYNPWPARLLDLAPWIPQSRTREKVDREYDKEKYAHILDSCSHRVATEPLTAEDVKRSELSELYPSSQRLVARGNQLFLTDANLMEFREEHTSLLESAMRDAIAVAEVVIELGCGYGYNLWRLRPRFPDKLWLGGEFSPNAVRLAGMLYRNDSRLRVEHFDYYDTADDLFRHTGDRPTVVFTSHSIEQLPSAAPFLVGLTAHRAAIRDVFHFEPVYELHGDGLLGLLRRRYTEVNDYNRDLLTTLCACSDIRVVQTQGAVLGSTR
jgi:hypothetical protein